MPLEQHDKRFSAVDGLPTGIGSGWLSGEFSIVLSAIGLGERQRETDEQTE